MKRLFFAAFYNTTTPVNAILTFGAVVPYIIFLAYAQALSLSTFIMVVSITLLATLYYGIIYLINDRIDQAKDDQSGTSKQTARHILGNKYYALPFMAVLTLGTIGIHITWPHITPYFLAYGCLLAILSVIHSVFTKGKMVTVFIERFVKICAPLFLLYIMTPNATTGSMLGAGMLVYPLGFTADYAYRGYLRDRLSRPAHHRLKLYSVYWALVAAAFTALRDRLHIHPTTILLYGVIYFAIILAARTFETGLPMPFLEDHYRGVELEEKRRLIIYGAASALMLTGSLAYALLS